MVVFFTLPNKQRLIEIPAQVLSNLYADKHAILPLLPDAAQMTAIANHVFFERGLWAPATGTMGTTQHSNEGDDGLGS